MIDELEAYLREEGYLPEREPLSAEGIHQRVLEAFMEHLSLEQAGEQAQRLECQLTAGVEAATPSAAPN